VISQISAQSFARLILGGLGPVLAVCLLFALPAPAHGQAPPDYEVNPGDELQIDVWREEDLQRIVIVRPDGKFSFPLSGEVKAADRTPAEIQAELSQKLRVYIPEAVVTVTVKGIEGNRIYVIGQVNNPGTFVMNPQINVLQALSLAGGMTAFASSNNIIILRSRGAEQVTRPFRFDDVARGRNLEQNILLEAGDVIIVP
jgi:polysaccharide biosynthesis/export protein